MRIILLNQFYVPDAAPAGRHLHDLAVMLAARGHDVRVICSRRPSDGAQLFPKHGEQEGVHITRLPAFGPGRRGFLSKLADSSSFYALLAARLAYLRPRPDLILALTTPPYLGLLGKLSASLHGSQYAHWMMDLYPDLMAARGTLRPKGLPYHFLELLTERQMHGAGLLVAVGPHLARRASAYLFEDEPRKNRQVIEWVPLWSDPALTPWPENESNPLRVQRGWQNEKFVLMYFGEMGLGRRFEEFLVSALDLGPQGPLWAFAGGGKQRGELEKWTREYPQARVQLLPQVPREQLRESLCAADVHLISQDAAWQGLSVPSQIQDSFAVGKPVIFVGGGENESAEWIDDSGGGWTVPEGAYAKLLDTVRQAQDPSERQRRGRAARAYAERHFDLRTNCAKIAALLERGRRA